MKYHRKKSKEIGLSLETFYSLDNRSLLLNQCDWRKDFGYECSV